VARRGDRERVRPQGVPLDERGGSAPIVIAVLREAVVDPVDSMWTRWRRPNLGSTGRTREPAQRGRRAGPARTSHRPARPHLPGRVLADVPAASRQTHQSIGTVRNYLAAPIGELGVASRSKAFRTAPTTLVLGGVPLIGPWVAARRSARTSPEARLHRCGRRMLSWSARSAAWRYSCCSRRRSISLYRSRVERVLLR